MVAAGKPNLLGVGRDGNLNAEHRAQRTEMSRRIDTGLELQRLMKMPLPTKMEDALRWYFDLEAAAHATGVKRGWEVIEAWLGTHDLFYLLAVLLNRHDIIKPWLFARCREVQEDPNDHLDLWARDHYKSSIITFGLTIFDILKDPEITVGIFSHTSSIATAFLRQIKMELETNERLYALYPDVLYQWPARESPKWSEKEGIIVKRKSNPKEATIEAWGLVDGQPTSKHFRLRVYDDVVTRESVQTPEAIKRTTAAWELSDNLGISHQRGGRVRYIGTRYALYDTYSTLMVRKVVKVRLHPATHNGRFDGSPVFLTDKEWETKVRTQGRATVAAQLLQNPMADEGNSFHPEWLRAYEVRPRTLNVYILCDPSRGRSATSDNTAIAVIGIGAGGAKYLLDGAAHHMSLSERWLHLRGFYRKWSSTRGVQRVAVGYERFGAQSDDEYFQEQMELDFRKKVPDPYFQIEELSWVREGGNSKQERVERLEPDFRNGRFFLPLSVMHEGKPAKWRVDSDPSSRTFGVVDFMAGGGLTSQQMGALEGGSPDLICRPIIQRDPSMPSLRNGGGRYDLTKHFIDEYLLFPHGQFKDLIDAASRIYDINPVAPLAPSSRTSSDPHVYADGV